MKIKIRAGKTRMQKKIIIMAVIVSVTAFFNDFLIVIL